MRFFEQQSFKSIGAAFGIGDDTAQKRVTRALEKLHVLLRKRGVTLAFPAVTAALGADSLTTAPAGLAASITAGVVGGSVSGGVVATNLIKNITMTKLKFGLFSAVLAIGGGAVLVHLNNTNQRLRTDIEQLREQQQIAAQPTVLDQGSFASEISKTNESQPSDAELLRLRGQIGRMNLELQTLRSNRSSEAKLAAILLHPLDLSQFPDSYMQIKASLATNAGTVTPSAVLQTWLWAQRNGDLDGLFAVWDWPDGTSAKKKLEDATENSNAAQRVKRSDGAFEDYRLVAMWPLGDDFYLGVFDESGNPAAFDKTFTGKQFFHKTQDGWKICNYTPSQGAFLKDNGGWRNFESETLAQ